MMKGFARHRLLVLLMVPLALPAQAAPQAAVPQLSPQAAYDQAILPVDITHRSIANWSDSELAALNVAVLQAHDGCVARTVKQFAGDDLLAFARLCALGQTWPVVRAAATSYITAQHQSSVLHPELPVPLVGLTQAYAFVIDASLQMKDDLTALTSCRDMLHAVPYTALASEASDATIRYLQLIHRADALVLLEMRQPMLLALLRAGPVAGAAASALSMQALYADAIQWPMLLQLDDAMPLAAERYAELEAALPADLPVDDGILIAETRRQYALLGKPMPALTPTSNLLHASREFPTKSAELVVPSGTATAYLLFPEWCAQCVRMGAKVAEAADRWKADGAHVFALLAQDHVTLPAVKPVAADKAKAAHTTPAAAVAIAVEAGPPSAAQLLIDTPTFVVPSATLKSFAASDFPMLIVADGRGMVRFVQVAPENVLVKGSLLDQVVALVEEQWKP